MIKFLACIGLIAILFLAVVGAYTFICIFNTKRLPMDKTNRINHIRLWWFVLTRPELFAPNFEWLKNDEFKNINK